MFMEREEWSNWRSIFLRLNTKAVHKSSSNFLAFWQYIKNIQYLSEVLAVLFCCETELTCPPGYCGAFSQVIPEKTYLQQIMDLRGFFWMLSLHLYHGFVYQ